MPPPLRRNRDSPDLMKPGPSIPEELEVVPSPKIDLQRGIREGTNVFLIPNQVHESRAENSQEEGALIALKIA